MVHHPGGDCYWEGGQPNGYWIPKNGTVLEKLFFF